MNRRGFLAFASSVVAAGASTLAVPAGAQGAAFPTRPVSLFVGFPAGSVTDLLARVFASELRAHLGETVIVENKPGAGGTIALAAVAHAKNGGYSLCMVTPSSIVTGPLIYKNLTFDPIKDLAPVIKLVTSTVVLLVSAQSPVTSLHDLVQRMKERTKENSLQYNSTGNSTSLHLLSALLAKLAGAHASHVPYKSPAQQITSLIAGDVDFGFVPLVAAVTAVKSGRVRALGVTSAEPSSLLPGVPSLYGAGLEVLDKANTFSEADPFFGVVAPKDTPDAVVQTLNRAFTKVLSNPSVQEKVAAMGFSPVPAASASEFAQFIRRQIPFWDELLKNSGAKND